MLNPGSPVPLYRQLADALEQRIQGGEFREGSRIPSEPELAQLHGIGRPTVRQATDQLVRRGLLERRRGAGTFVCQPPAEVDLFSLGGTIAAFLQGGLEPVARWVTEPHLVRVSRRRQQPFAGQQAFRARRLSSLEGRAVLLEELYLSAEVFPGLDRQRLGHRSLSELVRRHYHLEPSGARQSFAVQRLAPRRARWLSLAAREPVLWVRRTIDFPIARAAVFAELFCATQRVVFSQTIGALSP